MTDYGRVRSNVKPEPLVIDDFSVWVNSEITEISENAGTDSEFTGYEYSMKQYSKDEFILMQSRENAALGTTVANVEDALIGLYEAVLG